MKLKVYSPDGAQSAEKEFDIPVFEDNRGVQSLKDLIVLYQANKRQGTAKAKTRSEVRGSGKKVYRQKGTGNARHGDRQSPIYVGGGVAHGPKVRDWSKDMNKKERKLAFTRALFDKASEGSLDLIEAFQVDQPKTKIFNAIIERIQPEKGKVLIVDGQFNDDTIRAARNLERVQMCEADTLNAWDIVRYQKVIISEAGFEKVLARVK